MNYSLPLKNIYLFNRFFYPQAQFDKHLIKQIFNLMNSKQQQKNVLSLDIIIHS